jgi:CheY-like chemotaxis protein
MIDLKISLCEHATTAVFIDDNDDFLEQIGSRFNEILPYKTFNNPIEAIQYLNEESKEGSFIDRCITISEEGRYDAPLSRLEIRNIQKEINHSDRFKEIAVVIIDYAMPGMDGIEFCRQLKKRNKQIILLTGEADDQIALNALNKGYVNVFIKKSVHNLRNVLLEEIRACERRYFINLSNIILSQCKLNIIPLLEDETVAHFFYKIIQENNLVEHYLINDLGDFLLADKDGNLSLFSIKSDEEIQGLYDYAAIDMPKESLISIKNKEKIPLFSSQDELDNTPTSAWENHLEPITLIPGSNQYYFAYKKIQDKKKLSLEKIVSYQDFLYKFN